MISSSMKNGQEEMGDILTKQILDVDDRILKEVKQKSDISGIEFKAYFHYIQLKVSV